MNTNSLYQIQVRETELRVCFLANELTFYADPEHALQFVRDVITRLDEDHQKLILDIEELNHVNSSVLGTFVKLKKALPEDTIEFGIIGANAAIRKVMALTRLEWMLVD